MKRQFGLRLFNSIVNLGVHRVPNSSWLSDLTNATGTPGSQAYLNILRDLAAVDLRSSVRRTSVGHFLRQIVDSRSNSKHRFKNKLRVIRSI